jgi:hypothetical protein
MTRLLPIIDRHVIGSAGIVLPLDLYDKVLATDEIPPERQPEWLAPGVLAPTASRPGDPLPNEEPDTRPGAIRRNSGGPYCLAAMMLFSHVGELIRGLALSGDPQIGYVMESGAEGRGQTMKLWSDNYADERQRRDLRMLSLTFEDKRRVLPLQAADLLAYELFKHLPAIEARTNGRPATRSARSAQCHAHGSRWTRTSTAKRHCDRRRSALERRDVEQVTQDDEPGIPIAAPVLDLSAAEPHGVTGPEPVPRSEVAQSSTLAARTDETGKIQRWPPGSVNLNSPLAFASRSLIQSCRPPRTYALISTPGGFRPTPLAWPRASSSPSSARTVPPPIRTNSMKTDLPLGGVRHPGHRGDLGQVGRSSQPRHA